MLIRTLRASASTNTGFFFFLFLAIFPLGAGFACVWYLITFYGVFSGGVGKSHVLLGRSCQRLRVMTVRASPAGDALTF